MNFDSKDENHVLLPKFVGSISPVNVEESTWPWPSSARGEEVIRDPGKCFSEVFSVVRLVFTVTWPLESSLCKRGVFEQCTQVPNYTSDFYPRLVIKNIFKDLIICIFSFRVNPLKGSLIPCSTVLTKCFHIFFQLDSLFHFWKMLCNYFLM